MWLSPAQVFVLAHTEELLTAQEGLLLDKVKRIEKQQGISVRGRGPRRASRGAVGERLAPRGCPASVLARVRPAVRE